MLQMLGIDGHGPPLFVKPETIKVTS
jgi:hypothetical protein